MCGIVGVYSYADQAPVEEQLLRAMCQSIHHRGPDEEGVFLDGSLGLGIRRLSIIDLVTGSQPMANEDKTVTVVFNGEIYNYRDLRDFLQRKGHRLCTRSDTEALVHLYEEFGAGLVDRLRGMFAFALWDAPRRMLLLARDRLGIKPLYYTLVGNRLAFASEIKALLCCPWVERRLDLEALDEYLTYKYVPAPRTMFQGIHKLPPGSILTCTPGGVRLDAYWDAPSARAPARSAAEWEEGLEAHLREAVRLHLVSDVPLGVFLSGGLDSSTVLAFMREVGADPIRAFSISFDVPGFDELPYARQVAERYEARHETFVVSPAEVSGDILVELVAQLDEPLADDAAVATHYLSRLSRQSVTVALSGAGGDEVFGGYPHYLGDRAGRLVDALPRAVRQCLPGVGRALPASPQRRGPLRRLARFLEHADLSPTRRHIRYVTQLNFSEAMKRELAAPAFRDALGRDAAWAAVERHLEGRNGDILGRAMWGDLRTYLVDDVLTMTDKMSMWHSLEVRVPLLDHPLVEYMAAAPSGLKVGPASLKVLLRRLMRKRLPPEVMDRPKHGFAVPLVAWVGQRLRPFIEEVLLDAGAACRIYFDPAVVARLLDEHAAGRADHSHRLWQLVVFDLWHRAYLGPEAPHPVKADAIPAPRPARLDSPQPDR